MIEVKQSEYITVTPNEPYAKINFNDVPQSRFPNRQIDMSRVNKVDIVIQTDPNLRIELDSIQMEAVPEPFSLITMGTSIAAFIRKRKSVLAQYLK